ncbi:MAG: hypothetical protein ACOY90_14145 [Candidatus Zhuqueibacterota bacterium]
MKAKAEELVNSLRIFIQELEVRQHSGSVQKKKQLEIIQQAMHIFQRDAISIPDEMIMLESRLKTELEQESSVVSDVYDYLKREIQQLFHLEKFSPELEGFAAEVLVAEKETEEVIQEHGSIVAPAPCPQVVPEEIPEPQPKIIVQEPPAPKVKKVIIKDDSQVTLRPSFRYRQR